jgi:hypothetical protein
MQGILSVLMMVSFIGLIVGLVKPSVVKMKSRWRVFFVWLGVSMVLSMGLDKPPKQEKIPVKQEIVTTVEKDKEPKVESLLYQMFNKEEKKEVVPVVKEEKVEKKDPKQLWKEDTDESKVDYIGYLFSLFPSVEKFKSRHGEEALKPMLFNIVDCIDKAVNSKKYKHQDIDTMTDACMRMELLKNSKR